jgi:hypothetical protein
MKQHFILLFLSIALQTFPVAAQRHQAGLALGVNRAFLEEKKENLFADPFSDNAITAPNGGLYYHFYLGKWLMAGTEINYIQKGEKVASAVRGGVIKTDLKYLQFPLYIGFRATPKITLLGGGYIARAIQQQIKIIVDGQPAQVNKSSLYPDWDKGLLGGIRYSPLKGWAASLQYQIGYATPSNLPRYNRVYRLNIEYTITK